MEISFTEAKSVKLFLRHAETHFIIVGKPGFIVDQYGWETEFPGNL
jgi:hypothetical protein